MAMTISYPDTGAHDVPNTDPAGAGCSDATLTVHDPGDNNPRITGPAVALVTVHPAPPMVGRAG